MNTLDRRGLKAASAERLRQAPLAQRIILIWAGASAGISLLVSFLSFLLDSQIELTGGLSGIGLRSVLSTAQSLLSLASMALLPFWNLGFTACVLRFVRQEEAGPRNLLDGFRRFGPALRLMLLRYALYMGLAIGASYVGMIVLSMTPLAMPLYQLVEDNQELFLSGEITEEMILSMMDAMVPMLIGCLVLYVALIIPVSYRLRLAEFRVMDDPRCGALMALRESNQRMRRNCVSLFKLDLSFWWYFLAEFVAAGLCYGDLFLSALGITLPVNADAAFFIFYIIGMAAQVALLYFRGNYVQTTYGLFYQAVSPQKSAPPQETGNGPTFNL